MTDTGGPEPWAELDWIGRRLRVGKAAAQIRLREGDEGVAFEL